MFSLFKRKQAAAIVIEETPHPNALFSGFSLLGEVHIKGNPSDVYLQTMLAVRKLIFPNIKFVDIWDKQKHDSKLQALRSNLNSAYFRIKYLEEYVEYCNFERTQELKRAFNNLKGISFVNFSAMNDEILLAIPEQLQIILSTKSNHPGWQPSDVFDVSATEIKPQPLMIK